MRIKSFKNKMFYGSVLLVFCFQISFAQYEDLQNNPDISWIAEFSSDHIFSLDEEAYFLEGIKLVKFQSDPANMIDANMDNWMTDWLYQSLMKHELDCYKDSLLQHKLSRKELHNIIVETDTVIPFDNSAYEEGYVIVSSSLNPKDIKQWRAHQIIFYNDKTENFGTRLLSIAPLVYTETEDHLIPLLWIKMNEKFPKNFDITSSKIPWSILTSSRNNHLEADEINITINTGDFDFRKKLKQQAFNTEKPIESDEGYGSNDFLNKNDVWNVYNRKDTIVDFSPAPNYNELITVSDNSFDPDIITQYRLVQQWSFDKEKKKLVNQLKAIAPMYKVYDESNIYRFSRGLYYIRYDKN